MPWSQVLVFPFLSLRCKNINYWIYIWTTGGNNIKSTSQIQNPPVLACWCISTGIGSSLSSHHYWSSVCISYIVQCPVVAGFLLVCQQKHWWDSGLKGGEPWAMMQWQQWIVALSPGSESCPGTVANSSLSSQVSWWLGHIIFWFGLQVSQCGSLGISNLRISLPFQQAFT